MNIYGLIETHEYKFRNNIPEIRKILEAHPEYVPLIADMPGIQDFHIKIVVIKAAKQYFTELCKSHKFIKAHSLLEQYPELKNTTVGEYGETAAGLLHKYGMEEVCLVGNGVEYHA